MEISKYVLSLCPFRRLIGMLVLVRWGYRGVVCLVLLCLLIIYRFFGIVISDNLLNLFQRIEIQVICYYCALFRPSRHTRSTDVHATGWQRMFQRTESFPLLDTKKLPDVCGCRDSTVRQKWASPFAESLGRPIPGT